MPKAIDPAKRQAILNAIQAGAGSRSRNGIAKEFGVAPRTVGKIAEEAGLTDAWDRTHTARASQAKQIDNRARRAALVQAYLDDAERVRERLWEPAEQVTAVGKVVTLSLPNARDVRDFAMAGSSLIKTTIDVEKHDVESDNGGSAVDQWLRHLLGKD